MASTNKDERALDDRRKVILTFQRESLEELDKWREDHKFRGTRTSLFRESLELFMWLWEKREAGAKILIQKPDGAPEEVHLTLRRF